MGQSQSATKNPHQVQDFYSNYIQQQQLLIQQQQLQINNLYRLNLSSPQSPSNITFQQQQPHTQIPNTSQLQLPSSKPQKLDPYKILGLPKQFDMKTLKKAYLKTAMKTHPDRGGSEKEFQKVSIAYTILMKKLQESNNSHSHTELQEQSRGYAKQQNQTQTQNIHMRDEFNVDLFNKIYDENRMNDVYDRGYGEWMKQTDTLSIKDQPKMFQGNFNKDLFNSEFEKHKQEVAQQNGSQLVQYKEPEVRISHKNQDSLMVLGRGKVDNFSGESGGLNFRDYRDAFTNSNLIGVDQVNLSQRSTSMKSIEKDRSNLSYQLSPEDQKRVAIQQQQQQNEEQQRVQRLQVYDHQSEDMYNKIHQLLLRQ